METGVWEGPQKEQRKREKILKAPPKKKRKVCRKIVPKVGLFVVVQDDSDNFTIGKLTKKIEEYFQITCLEPYPGESGAFFWGEQRFRIIKASDIILIPKLDFTKSTKNDPGFYSLSADDYEIIQEKLAEEHIDQDLI